MKIVILGSGNVATHLGVAFKNTGYNIIQVWSRDIKHAETLATLLHTRFTNDINQIDPSADLYLISVSDDAIPTLNHQIGSFKGVVAHTSGSTSIDVFTTKFAKYGVFYPFQTFSKERKVDLNQVPILIEASDKKTLLLLEKIALSLSDKVQECSSEQRKSLHIAAVFACNFVNHLYTVAQKLLEANQLDFDLLRPLILETAIKAQSFMPETVQTGPAKRDDKITLNSHQEQLGDTPDLLAIYNLLSDHIRT